MPTFNEEKKLWKKGCKSVACIDEVGRGALCGPVVAAAVVANSNLKILPRTLLGSIKDSKKLTPKKREEFYKILTRHPQIRWGTGRVSERVIDKINILEATKLAMKKAIRNLQRTDLWRSKIDFIILDGKMSLDVDIPQRSIVKADEKVFSCAAASIIAKVTRDRLICNYAKKYPEYGFEKHKGYGTKYHFRMLKKYGRCVIHRKSFHFHYGGTKTKAYKIEKK